MNLSKREKTLLYILLCVIILIGGSVLLVVPVFQKTVVLENDYLTAKAKLQTTKASIIDYSNLDNDIKEINERLRVITENFYGTMENEDVDKLITELSQKYYLIPSSLEIEDITKEEIVNYQEYLANTKKDGGENQTGKKDGEINDANALQVFNVTMSVHGRIADLQKLVDAANVSKTMKIDTVSYANQLDENKAMVIRFKIFMI